MTDNLRPDDVDDLKVADLRKELSHRRLSSTGRKSELQDRLKEYLAEDYVEDEAAQGKEAEADKADEELPRRRSSSSAGRRSVSPKPGHGISPPPSPITRSMTRHERENSVSPKPNTPPPTPSSDADGAPSVRGRRRSPKPEPSPTASPAPGKVAPQTPAPARGRRRSRAGEDAQSVSPKPEDQATAKEPQERRNAAKSPKPVASPKAASDSKASPKPVQAKSPKPSKAPAVLETLLMDPEEDILAEELKEVQKAEAQTESAKQPTSPPARKAAPAVRPPAQLAAASQSGAGEETEFQRVREPNPAKCAPSVTVRIDGLKRPFPLPKFKAALEPLSGVATSNPSNFFISSKRTHCYVTMESVEQAEAFRNHMCGIKYQEGYLSAEFSDITATEANKLSEEERDLRMKVMASRDSSTTQAAVAAPKQQAELEQPPSQTQTQTQTQTQARAQAKPTPGTIRAPEARRKLVSIDNAAANSIFRGAIGSLKRQASSSSVEEHDSSSVTATAKRNKGVEENGATTQAARTENGVGKRARSAHQDGSDEAEDTLKRPREIEPARTDIEAPIATLDDLFRKTIAKPALYWLPVTEEEVQRRREAIAQLKKASAGETTA